MLGLEQVLVLLTTCTKVLLFAMQRSKGWYKFTIACCLFIVTHILLILVASMVSLHVHSHIRLILVASMVSVHVQVSMEQKVSDVFAEKFFPPQ